MKDIQKESTPAKIYFLPVLVILVVAFIVHMIVRHIKNTPHLHIDDTSITFGGKQYLWKDLEHIDFTGKQDFGVMMSYRIEALTIKFYGEKNRHIFDRMYANAWEMKAFIKDVVIDKKTLVSEPLTPVKDAALDLENFEVFKGNPFFSFRGVMIWGFILFLLSLIILTPNGPRLVLLIASGCWYLIGSFWMYYFKVSDNYLMIKNHHFFWISKVYNVKDIYEVVYETAGKQPNGLRLITRDYKTQMFYAGTLTDKTWLRMKTSLEQRGIKVRNECI